MGSPADAVETFLDEHPDVESAIEELIDVDADGPWEFHDISLDSGTFGEIAATEIVEKSDDQYRLADREATKAALVAYREEPTTSAESEPIGQDATSGSDAQADSKLSDSIRLHIPEHVRERGQFLLALTLLLTFLGYMRSLSRDELFRENFIYLKGNDPYAFRYAVDVLLENDVGLFAFSEMAALGGTRASSTPLVAVIGYWSTVLFGGNPETTGAVVVWLPVAAAIIVGILVAAIALLLTGDERVALLSVGALAITPAHALYSSIGFFDHHPFDYVWLALMVLAVVWINTDLELSLNDGNKPVHQHLRSRRTWAGTLILGIATAGAVLTWSGSPLLLLGFVLYAPVKVLSDIRAGHRPIWINLPVMVGLALATIFAGLFHIGAGFQESAVVLSPLIVCAGFFGITVAGEYVRRTNGDLLTFGGLIAAGFVGILILFAARIGPFARFATRFGDLVGRARAAETSFLFRLDLDVWFGMQDTYGLLIIVIVPTLVWASVQCLRRYEPRWLLVTSFGWALFLLSAIQIRFAGEAAVVTSVQAGVGLVKIFDRQEIIQRSTLTETRSRVRFHVTTESFDTTPAVIIVVVLLVFAIPGGSMTATMEGSTTHDEAWIDAAEWIAADSAQQDGDQYVLSWWSENRMYNYRVSGWGPSYGYADGKYQQFVQSSDPDSYFPEFDGNATNISTRFNGNVDYITVRAGSDFPPDTTYSMLAERLGGAVETQNGRVHEGSGHYRFVYAADIEPSPVLVFEVVPGARIEAPGLPDTTYRISTELSTEIGDVTYTRIAESDSAGNITVSVAYPGEYVVGEGVTATVTEADIQNGSTIRVDPS